MHVVHVMFKISFWNYLKFLPSSLYIFLVVVEFGWGTFSLLLMVRVLASPELPELIFLLLWIDWHQPLMIRYDWLLLPFLQAGDIYLSASSLPPAQRLIIMFFFPSHLLKYFFLKVTWTLSDGIYCRFVLKPYWNITVNFHILLRYCGMTQDAFPIRV